MSDLYSGLPTDGSLHFCIPKLEISHVKARAIRDVRLHTHAEFLAENVIWDKALKSILPSHLKLGIEPDNPVYMADALDNKATLLEALEVNRTIKSDYEIGCIRYACEIATSEMLRFLKAAKLGTSALVCNQQLVNYRCCNCC